MRVTANNSLQATTPAAFTSARFARLRFGLRVLRLSSMPLGGLAFAFVTSALALWLAPSPGKRGGVCEPSASGRLDLRQAGGGPVLIVRTGSGVGRPALGHTGGGWARGSSGLAGVGCRGYPPALAKLGNPARLTGPTVEAAVGSTVKGVGRAATGCWVVSRRLVEQLLWSKNLLGMRWPWPSKCCGVCAVGPRRSVGHTRPVAAVHHGLVTAC